TPPANTEPSQAVSSSAPSHPSGAPPMHPPAAFLRPALTAIAAAALTLPSFASAQQPGAAGAVARPANQPIDSAYTALIAEHLQDSRISTELVDYLPASETVPTPLDFFG